MTQVAPRHLFGADDGTGCLLTRFLWARRPRRVFPAVLARDGTDERQVARLLQETRRDACERSASSAMGADLVLRDPVDHLAHGVLRLGQREIDTHGSLFTLRGTLRPPRLRSLSSWARYSTLRGTLRPPRFRSLHPGLAIPRYGHTARPRAPLAVILARYFQLRDTAPSALRSLSCLGSLFQLRGTLRPSASARCAHESLACREGRGKRSELSSARPRAEAR